MYKFERYAADENYMGELEANASDVTRVIDQMDNVVFELQEFRGAPFVKINGKKYMEVK